MPIEKLLAHGSPVSAPQGGWPCLGHAKALAATSPTPIPRPNLACLSPRLSHALSTACAGNVALEPQLEPVEATEAKAEAQRQASSHATAAAAGGGSDARRQEPRLWRETESSASPFGRRGVGVGTSLIITKICATVMRLEV